MPGSALKCISRCTNIISAIKCMYGLKAFLASAIASSAMPVMAIAAYQGNAEGLAASLIYFGVMIGLAVLFYALAPKC